MELGTGRTAIAIDAGYQHTCAVLDDHSVKRWGHNASGQSGFETTDTLGNNPGEMGDNLPTIKLGTGRTAYNISAGDAHTCALLDQGYVKCWGRNGPQEGLLGIEKVEIHGDVPGTMGDALPLVKLGAGKQALKVQASVDSSCALLAGGEVKCWGRNWLGIVGQYIGDEPGEMGDSLAPVQLGTGESAVDIIDNYTGSGGGSTTCVQLAGGGVKCWGKNGAGQLGQGNKVYRGDNEVLGDSLPRIDL